MIFLLDGKPFVPPDTNIDVVETLVNECLTALYKYKVVKSGRMGIGSYMLPGTEHVIACVKVEFGDKINRIANPAEYQKAFADANRELGRAELVVHYESIYGDKGCLDTREA
jgi:hypothetical protein